MTFVSVEFVILFLITLFGFARCKDKKQKQIILLIASYIFYAYWDIRFLGLLIVETYICFYLAKKIKRTENTERRKKYCTLGVVVSLVILGFFKYFNFFIENIQDVFRLERVDALYIVLPVGISFYTFQAMSYLIDVYRGDIEARDEFTTVSLYISFFPQLVAGPIVRAADFLPQCDREHCIKRENIEEAIQIFVFGLLKKVVVADRLAVCVDTVFATPEAYSALSIIFAVMSYSVQIYCDFSGYSDMAIGIAKIFDYDLCKNFNVPYISKNPTEFWRRWHISLSTWLKDYLYIPLGGNRRGKYRTYINLLLTMVLGGLWHGASWNFVIWGTLHGVALVLHKCFLQLKKRINVVIKNKAINDILTVISMIVTYVFVCICWIFFRTDNVADAIGILARVLTWDSGVHYIFVYSVMYIVGTLVCHVYALLKHNGEGIYPMIKLDKFRNKLVLCLILWIIVIFSYDGDNAFIFSSNICVNFHEK